MPITANARMAYESAYFAARKSRAAYKRQARRVERYARRVETERMLAEIAEPEPEIAPTDDTWDDDDCNATCEHGGFCLRSFAHEGDHDSGYCTWPQYEPECADYTTLYFDSLGDAQVDEINALASACWGDALDFEGWRGWHVTTA